MEKNQKGNEAVSDYLCLKGNSLQIANPDYFQMRCPGRVLGGHQSSQFKRKNNNNNMSWCLRHLSVQSIGDSLAGGPAGKNIT
jgi:hypothetical protein